MPAPSHIPTTSTQSPLRALIGVSRQDITPPIGIYARSWAAAKHDAAEGIHRPLTLTCLTFQSNESDPPLVLISADLGWWHNRNDERSIRDPLLTHFNLDESRLMFCLTHTHAGPSLQSDLSPRPGGHLIQPYHTQLRAAALNAIEQALHNRQPATLDWRYGRCDLAANRDLPDPNANRIVCGYNPDAPADDTLLLARITTPENKILATIVNYACHPTTLAWDNKLISPDFVGAMREIIESHTHSPTLFLQGASGELAPAEQYTGDPAVADRHGRRLAHAALATLESMTPPNTHLTFDKVIESGAPLAAWRLTEDTPSTTLSATLTKINLPLKPLPSLAEIEEQWRTCPDPVIKERLWRKRGVRKAVGDGATTPMPLWTWRLGDAFLVGHPNEAYSLFQTTLRQHFSPAPIAVMNLVTGSSGYLPPRDLYDKDLYQVWQSPFQPGALEQLIDSARDSIEHLRKS